MYYLLNNFLDDLCMLSVNSYKTCFLCAHSAAFLFWKKRQKNGYYAIED